MYVVDVIPFSRSAPPGTLTYRSRDELAPGTIVDVMLRKTAIQGLVVDCTPVAEAKAQLKGAHFTPSSSAPSRAGVLPKELLEAAETVAEYHAVTLGSALAALFGEHAKSGATLSFGSLKVGDGFAEKQLEAPISERAAGYRNEIDVCVGQKRAALLIVPTLAELEYWKKEFASYKPLVLSGALTGARRVKALENARDHSGLIIATPSFSWTPVDALGCIIIERISAGGYVLPKRPHLDMARALRSLAQARHIPFLLGDYPLPLEYRQNPEAALAYPLSVPISIHDARRPEDEQKVDDDGPWKVVPEKVLASMRAVLEEGGRIAVLASRRGYAPAVVCRDCGQTVTDERGMQLSFTMAGGRRLLRSADGKTVIDAKIVCERCGSWNLLPLGVGVERVVEELSTAFPDTRIIAPEVEKLRTSAGAKKALYGLHEPGTIVVGTEGLLTWLLAEGAQADPFDLAVIASSDSLLALPFWKSRERFVRLAYFFSGFARKLSLITRKPDDAAVQCLATPGSSAFLEEESMLRRALSYPPFGTVIVVHVEGNARALEEMHPSVLEAFTPHRPSILPDRVISKSILRRTYVAALPQDTWPDIQLSKALQSLPPSVDVRIDPESFW